MKSKNSRLDAIKIIISSKEVGSQEELLQELAKEGFQLTQAERMGIITACTGTVTLPKHNATYSFTNNALTAQTRNSYSS